MFELVCESCGAEYHITCECDTDEIGEPAFCPFCGEELDDYILEEEEIDELSFDEE